MKHGLPLIRGDFASDARATSWRQKLRTKATCQTLLNSDLRVVVVTLFAHPWLNMRRSIQRQIDEAKVFVRTHPEWFIALSARDLESGLNQNRRALVLSLEGAQDVAETPEDLAWLWAEGVRIITPFHLTDDRLGGVALLRFPGNLASSGTYLSLVCPCFDSGGYRVNRRGITPHGIKVIEAMLAQKFWIDLAHIGDKTYETVDAMLGSSPRLWTHTVLRSHHKTERGITPEKLNKVKDTRGVVGLMPSTSMLRGDICSFAEQHRGMTAAAGFEAVGIGSDLNAPITGLPPDRAGKFGPKGFYRQDQFQALVQSASAEGASFPPDLALSRFIEAWARVLP